MPVDTAKLQDLLLRVKLPEMPLVALEANRMLDDPDSNAQSLAAIIMKDPAIVAQMLKICNSAQYGLSRRIGTISEAVAILGLNTVKRILFAIISHSLLNRPIEGYALEKGALWDNALACGIYARHIAQKAGFADPERAFIGAILRDIGKLALEVLIREHGTALQKTVQSDRCSFMEAEERLVGASHTQVGAELARQWNLPEGLQRVVEYHHSPSQLPPETPEESRKLVAIVHLADTLTMMSGAGLGIDGLMYPLDISVFDTLGISKELLMLEALYAELLNLDGDISRLSQEFSAAG